MPPTCFALLRVAVMQALFASGQKAAEIITRLPGHFRIAELEVRHPELEHTIRQMYANHLLEEAGENS